MKEKIIVGIISILVLIGAVFTTIIIRNDMKKEENYETRKISQIPITDECTEEYQIAQLEKNTQEASSSDEKISSNSALILKKYYKECGHTINEYAEMLPELVNMTEDEVSDKFHEWELISFSPKEVTLFKEFEGACGEHYSLREENGSVMVYKVLPDGTEQVYEKTGISTEFLTETDLIEMRSENGIQVYSNEELNKVLEDFE